MAAEIAFGLQCSPDLCIVLLERSIKKMGCMRLGARSRGGGGYSLKGSGSGRVAARETRRTVEKKTNKKRAWGVWKFQ